MNAIKSKKRRDEQNEAKRFARRDEKISRNFRTLRDGFMAQGMEMGEAGKRAIEEMTKNLK